MSWSLKGMTSAWRVSFDTPELISLSVVSLLLLLCSCNFLTLQNIHVASSWPQGPLRQCPVLLKAEALAREIHWFTQKCTETETDRWTNAHPWESRGVHHTLLPCVLIEVVPYRPCLIGSDRVLRVGFVCSFLSSDVHTTCILFWKTYFC